MVLELVSFTCLSVTGALLRTRIHCITQATLFPPEYSVSPEVIGVVGLECRMCLLMSTSESLLKSFFCRCRLCLVV